MNFGLQHSTWPMKESKSGSWHLSRLNTPQSYHLTTDLQVLQYRGSCSHFPSTLSLLPKINWGHHHPQETCWFSSPAHSPACNGGVSVRCHRVACPAAELPGSQRSWEQPRRAPGKQQHYSTCHTSLHLLSLIQGWEVLTSPLVIAWDRYAAATQAVHKARAIPCMCHTLRRAPATEMHTLPDTFNSSDDCISWFCSVPEGQTKLHQWQCACTAHFNFTEQTECTRKRMSNYWSHHTKELKWRAVESKASFSGHRCRWPVPSATSRYWHRLTADQIFLWSHVVVF